IRARSTRRGGAHTRGQARAGHERDARACALVVDHDRLGARGRHERDDEHQHDQRVTAHQLPPPTVRLRRSTTAPRLGSYWKSERALSVELLRSLRPAALVALRAWSAAAADEYVFAEMPVTAKSATWTTLP